MFYSKTKYSIRYISQTVCRENENVETNNMSMCQNCEILIWCNEKIGNVISNKWNKISSIKATRFSEKHNSVNHISSLS